jgi:hypothetical protein
MSCHWVAIDVASCRHDIGHGQLMVADDGMTEFLVNMSASADVLAMAKVEVDLASIPEGKNVSWNMV